MVKKKDYSHGWFAKTYRILRLYLDRVFRTDRRNELQTQALTTSMIPQSKLTKNNQSIPLPSARGSPHLHEIDSFGDRKRTELRYKEATKRLEDALKLGRSNWESFQIPDLTEVPIPQLRSELNKMLDARKSSIGNQDAWSKCKNAMSQMFTAMSPFAKNFLRVAKDGLQTSVLNPFGLLCNGFLLLITIADQEITRKNAIEEKLDYIFRQLEQLKITKRLPDGIPSDELVNRAMDVKSAAFTFLAVQIHYESRWLGVVGNITNTILRGDSDYESAEATLQGAIKEFNSTLSNFAHNIGFQVFERIEDIAETLARVEIGISGNTIASSSVATSAFFVRYEQNPYFTGRDELLKRLWDELSDHKPRRYNHRISLYGLGGVGKTQIALEYAYRHKSNYNYVFWISAVNQAQLLSGFNDIVKVTRCVKEINEPQELAKSVLEWLQARENWLLIIDNLDDITIVDGYLPTTNGTGHTLITTRNKNSEGIPAIGMEVEVMRSDDCIQLLLDRIPSIPMNPQIQIEARKIAEELGFLPLAIEQAAAYIRKSEEIEEFLVTYRKHRRNVLGWRPQGNYSYNYTVATTWRMFLEHLQSSCPNSVALMQLLVFLNPDEILVEYLRAGSKGLRPETQAIIENEFYLRESLDALESFSLIRVFGGRKISIHRLVQAVVQDDMDSNQRPQIVSAVVDLGLQSFPDISDESKRETCRRYRSQTITSLEHGRDSDIKWYPQWHVLAGRLANYLLRDGFYTDCLYWWRLTFDARVDVLGLEHLDTLRSKNGLGSSYYNLGRLVEAVKLFQETLEIQKRVIGLEHPDTLESMHGLAKSYWSLGRTKEAEKLDEDTLKIRKRVLGLDHQDTLRSMYSLSVRYWTRGRIKDAAQLSKETLEIRKRLLGLEHPDTLVSINALAISYWRLGRTTEAAQLLKETLKIRKRVLGLEHPDTLYSMQGLASLYGSMGRTKEAAQLNEETLEIRKRVLGLEHPDTLLSMNNLAVSYGSICRMKEAIQLLDKTLEIRRRVLGSEHPDTLQSMNNLAVRYAELGRMKEAAQLDEETLKIRKRIFGLEHPHTLISMDILASSYLRLGRTKDAAQLYKETLEIRKRMLGLEHPDTLKSMQGLAMSYSSQDRTEEAAHLDKETLEIQKRVLGLEHPDTLHSMNNLAVSYSDLGQIKEAAQLHEDTLKIQRRVLGLEHPHTLFSMDNLASSYWRLGRTKEAVQMYEETLELRKRVLGLEHPDTVGSMNSLTALYNELGYTEDARTVAQE